MCNGGSYLTQARALNFCANSPTGWSERAIGVAGRPDQIEKMTFRSHWGSRLSTVALVQDSSGDASHSSAEPAELGSSSVRRTLSRPAALEQLRPREVSRAAESPPPSPVDIRKKKSLADRIKGAISGRPFTVSAVVPGTGRTVNRPMRAGIPSDSAAVELSPEKVLIEEARQLSRVAESLAVSIGRPEAALWKRPAQSKAYRMMTKGIPWMKSAPLAEISTISGHRDSAARAHQVYGAPARGRGEIAEDARKLLGQLEAKRQALDEAAANFERARSAHEDSRRVSPASDQTRQAAERRSQAAAELRTASSALHAAISGSDLVGLKGLSYLAELHEKGDAFARKRINELQTKAHALRSDAYDRRDAIDLELHARIEEARTLMSIDHNLAAAEKTLLEAQGRLRDLTARLIALPAETAESSGAAPSSLRARLNNEIEQAQTVCACAQATQQRCLQGLDSIDAEFARLNDRITELMQLRPAADVQRDEAERSLAWLAGASSQLAKKMSALAKPEADVDTHATDELHERFVVQQSEMPQAFGSHPDAALMAALGTLSTRLQETGASAKLPLMMAMETVTNALADVTCGEAGRAARLLGALSAKPASHWAELAWAHARTRRETAGSQVDRTVSDVLAFNRLVAALPRGSDLLHALSRDGKESSVKEKTQALHVFWTADDACRKESDPSVVAWLGQAKRVALAGCRGETEAQFDDVDYGAYHAVRNGYLSNASGSLYDEHNARMKKAITEWVIRATSGRGSTNDVAQPAVWRRLVPTLNKTPLNKRLLNRGYDVAESMGLDSARLRVDRAVRRRMTGVATLIESSRRVGGGEGALDALFAQTLVDYLKLVDNRGRHLSNVKLTDRDTKKMIQRLPAVAQQVHVERFLTFIKAVAPHGSTAYEALERMGERLRSRIPAAQRPQATEVADDDLAATVRLLKTKRLSDKHDIVTFFKPFILDMALRDKVRLGGGGTLGLGLPTLPYGPETPVVSPLVFAEMSRSEEAFVQLFMPVLGIEMMFGKTRTKAKESILGVVAGSSLGKAVALQGAASVRASSQQAKTNATLMRFFRKRHQDEEMRTKMLNALESLVRWDMIEPERGKAYSGPLEAVFARNPEVSVSQVDAVADTTMVGAAVSARLPYLKFNTAHGIAQTIRTEPSFSVEAQRSRERRDERCGHVNVYAAVGDSAQQRASLGMAVAGAPFSVLPPRGRHHAHEGPQRESLGLQLGITRDIAWAMEKHEISPFLLDGKQDADLDRHYSTPVDMLQEISANREQWLMRCVETLDPDTDGNTDTLDNRMRAAVLLDEFEREIHRLGKNSKYCLYNVNYSMRGAASEWIDGYRGLAQLARKRGDALAERNAQEAIDDILVNRGTWRPLMLIVRERAKDSTMIGWRNLLRWQRTANVDGQRTAAQFPPP